MDVFAQSFRTTPTVSFPLSCISIPIFFTERLISCPAFILSSWDLGSMFDTTLHDESHEHHPFTYVRSTSRATFVDQLPCLMFIIEHYTYIRTLNTWPIFDSVVSFRTVVCFSQIVSSFSVTTGVRIRKQTVRESSTRSGSQRVRCQCARPLLPRCPSLRTSRSYYLTTQRPLVFSRYHMSARNFSHQVSDVVIRSSVTIIEEELIAVYLRCFGEGLCICCS